MKRSQQIAIQKRCAQQIAQQQARADLELAAKNGNIRAQQMLERWDEKRTDKD